ncbi:MAG: multiheme c-type cytochrome, partial [Acidobacteria bacterium]|nr:multiheme c-type cytochrome [Acidobacteriota bacterium]
MSERGRVSLLLAGALWLLGGDPAGAQLEGYLEHALQDPLKIVSAEACGECHIAEHEVWKTTPHATGFKTLHRKESAEAIAGKMGFRLIKRRSLCFGCHYTPQERDGTTRVISGVSCESCHGAAADWMDIHNDYGAGNDRRSEPAAHRASRLERSREAGMRLPSELYPVAANCFSCHTVPNEELVNVGGHTTGSATFELVKWSQGEIRHNFLRGSGDRNVESSIERKRLMYVTGRAMDVEFSLRGMAVAREEGVYAKAMARRVRVACSELAEIASRAALPEIDRILATLREVRVIPGNESALLAAAESVAGATRAFLDGREGSQLASLDGLVLGLDEPTEPEEELVLAESGGPSASGGGSPPVAPTGGGGGGSTPVTAGPTSDGGDSPPAIEAVSAEGELMRRIRPPESHDTLGPSSCGNCHGPQNGWWYGDRHFEAVNPFFEKSRKNVQIARLYGIDPAKMARGDQVCMDCHGSVVSGRERREVQDGVGCEDCHGPAADWLEPHKEGDKSLGVNRPGYLQALRLGKRELLNLEVRAQVCTSCHYVTDPRLISAGHPSGADFDYGRGMVSIKHWDHSSAGSSRIVATCDAAVAKRGAVPRVRRARLAGPAQPGPGVEPGTLSPATLASAVGGALDRAVRQVQGLLPRARPASSRPLPPRRAGK